MRTSEVTTACQSIRGKVDRVLTRLPIDPASVASVVGNLLGNPPDLVVRSTPHGQLVFLDTITDAPRVEASVLAPLLGTRGSAPDASDPAPVQTHGDAVDALLGGHVLWVRQGDVLALSMQQWPERDPSEPPAEIVPQGPHVGFVESLDTNIALLRHRIRDHRFRWIRLHTGSRAHTPAAVVHMRDLAHPELVDRVERKMRQTAVAASFATDTAMIQEWLTRISGALFPTMEATERPDVAAAALLEGRVLVLMDGSPVASVAPAVFAHILHTPMDYYNRSFDAWLKRMVRLGALLVALLSSPLFVAVATINQELIPARMVVSITQARIGVPLPVVLEVLVMEVIIEMVREAGIRMPGSIGQTVSIVGAIVIGQSAVMAGLISAPVVVVVAFAYIASTVIPSLDARVAIRMLRFPLILLAAWLGLFGLLWGLMVLFLYLLSLESFGVPYLAPVAPNRTRGLQDTIRRLPLTDMRRGFLARRRRQPQ